MCRKGDNIFRQSIFSTLISIFGWLKQTLFIVFANRLLFHVLNHIYPQNDDKVTSRGIAMHIAAVP